MTTEPTTSTRGRNAFCLSTVVQIGHTDHGIALENDICPLQIRYVRSVRFMYCSFPPYHSCTTLQRRPSHFPSTALLRNVEIAGPYLVYAIMMRSSETYRESRLHQQPERETLLLLADTIFRKNVHQYCSYQSTHPPKQANIIDTFRNHLPYRTVPSNSVGS